MLEILSDLPPEIDGLKAVGKVSYGDYEHVLRPMLDEARHEHRRLRFLYELGPEFEGFTAGALWDDAKLGLRSMRSFDGCALVTDRSWLRETARVVGFVMPCPVRCFDVRHREEAVEWLRSLPEEAAISHRLLADRGVVVVEIHEALRTQDFDELARTADTWIEGHGDLQGLVLHAPAFPGWENAASLLSHIRFVRNHRRNVRRIALAADSRVTRLAPRLADLFVKADVKAFRYDDLESAIDWAAHADGNTRTSSGAPTPETAERDEESARHGS